MFSIAICDDEEIICTEIEKILKSYINESKIKTEVYYSGEKLYEDLSNGKFYDLIFLDIELKLMNGVDIGLKIRRELKNEKIHIVYISGKDNYAMKLFDVRPLNFLIKPFTEQQVTEVFDKAMELSALYYEYFEFQREQTFYKFFYGDIIFFESKARKMVIHTVKSDYEFYGKINDIEVQTKGEFLRVHQSYLVNPLYIQQYNLNQVVLKNGGETISVSQSYRKEIRNRLLKKWGK